MRIEPSEDGGVDDFVIVEDGSYRMKVAGVSEHRSADGRVSWMVRMELVDGDLAGRTAVTDWLNFDERGMHRVRLVLGALGFDVSETLEVEPSQLYGRRAFVRVMTQESQRPADGRTQRRSRVTYDGWSPVEPAAETPESGSDETGSEHAAGGASGSSFAADEMPF